MSEIEVTVKCDEWRQLCADAVALAHHAAETALNDPDVRARGAPASHELCIVLADDAFVRELNRSYRGIDKPTNVLAFPSEDEAGRHRPPISGPRLLGDVIVARETLHGEATASGIPVADHLAHLVVHGVLHLLGYDHETEAEAALMETRETAILRRLDISDPYAREGQD